MPKGQRDLRAPGSGHLSIERPLGKQPRTGAKRPRNSACAGIAADRRYRTRPVRGMRREAQGRTEEEQRRETRKEGCLELRGRRSLVRCRSTLSTVAACSTTNWLHRIRGSLAATPRPSVISRKPRGSMTAGIYSAPSIKVAASCETAHPRQDQPWHSDR